MLTACGHEAGLGAATLVELLRRRAELQPDQTAYIFLRDGERDEHRITFGELDARARAIAAGLQAAGAAGQRALLLYPPGIEYIAGLFGCLYAGCVPVPAYPPDPSRLQRSLPRMLAIARDAQIAAALTITSIRQMTGMLAAQFPELARVSFIATDTLTDASAWQPFTPAPDALALLQYTSGSVGTPKGVMVTHANVIANEAMISNVGETWHDTGSISWLPPYHDMGLFGGILQAVYLGIPAVLMSPEAFLRKPLRWLQAISRYRISLAVGPDFAFDLCVRRQAAEPVTDLDLSSWRIAYNGSEPLRPATLERFAETFGKFGYKKSVMYPCYGMAEATLLVSGGRYTDEPVIRHFDAAGLEQHRVVSASTGAAGARGLVGCGRTCGDQLIAIVEPDTGRRAGATAVGEIWLCGSNVAAGYWQRPELTQSEFHARLDGSDREWLRTGDLGFVADGELFITGRLKDLVIIRGRNHYPQDIEATVQDLTPALRRGCGAAFALSIDERERLVIVQEVDGEPSDAKLPGIVADVRRAVAEHHDVAPYEIVLIKRGSAAKTTSGKIQRRACAAGYKDGSLDVIARWQAAAADEEPAPTTVAVPAPVYTPPPPPPPLPKATGGRALDAAAIESWLRKELSRHVGVPEREIDARQPLYAYGLDSLVALELTQDLEAWLGRPVPASTPYDYPTLEAIAKVFGTAPVVAAPAPAATAPAPTAAPAAATNSVATAAKHAQEPIAIVGMACRFPGAPDLDGFWDLLANARDAITEVPADRWDAAALFDTDKGVPGKSYTRWGGFVADIDQFDPELFGISPREAARIEPQQRMFLEAAWHALEDANISPTRLAGTETGVFAGVYNNDYVKLWGDDLELIDAHYGTGNVGCIIANRVSYTLDLQGPSVAIDTACSSSLVALHLACRALRAGECDLALAGGVNAILTPENHVYFSQARAMAADGRCKTFDSRADGFVRGEGVGVIVLKPLSRAIADGDRIYATVRGSAVNQDGRTNGLTAPNGGSQQRVMRRALADAGVAAGDLGYIEAHGTGTPIGDSMELQSLSAVIGAAAPGAAKPIVGAVKTNIGHLESAAGIAGVIKTALALSRELIPQNLHFKELNPHVTADALPLALATAATPWPRSAARPRLAGISSFGFGGTNSHVILEEAPARAAKPAAAHRPRHLLTISGATDAALAAVARQTAAAIKGQPVGDVCYTAAIGRAHHAHRLAVHGRTSEDLAWALTAFADGKPVPGARVGKCRPHAVTRVGAMFTGQGAQHAGMARALFDTEPLFRAALEQVAGLCAPHLERPLLSAMFSSTDDETIHDTAYTQPALFALEWALYQLWSAWGLRPAWLVGHSIGEYAAATVAGALPLAHAAALVCERGRLMQALPREGAMMIVLAPIDSFAARLAGTGVDVAAANSPKATVISGPAGAVAQVAARLEGDGVTVRPLKTSHAFHSSLMEPALDAFRAAAAKIAFAPTTLPIASNLTGELLPAGHVYDAAYWCEHLRRTVRFADGARAILAAGASVMVELGPSPTLVAAGRDISTETAWIAVLDRKRDDWEATLDAAAALYVAGVELDADAFAKPYAAGTIPLPRYPFQHARHWMPFPPRRSGRPAAPPKPAAHPLLARRKDPT